MDDFNPYAAPEVRGEEPPLPAEMIEEGRGVWRDGRFLVMAKAARLPSRCVVCNDPATFRLRRSLGWHGPLLYLMIVFPGLPFYAITALIVRKRAKVEIPLCQAHQFRRARGLVLAWGLAAVGVTLVVTSTRVDDGRLLGLAGGLVGVGAMIFGSLRSQVVTPRKIDRTHAWLNGVGRAYLASIPALPDPEARPASPAFPAGEYQF